MHLTMRNMGNVLLDKGFSEDSFKLTQQTDSVVLTFPDPKTVNCPAYIDALSAVWPQIMHYVSCRSSDANGIIFLIPHAIELYNELVLIQSEANGAYEAANTIQGWKNNHRTVTTQGFLEYLQTAKNIRVAAVGDEPNAGEQRFLDGWTNVFNKMIAMCEHNIRIGY